MLIQINTRYGAEEGKYKNKDSANPMETRLLASCDLSGVSVLPQIWWGKNQVPDPGEWVYLESGRVKSMYKDYEDKW